MNNILYKPVLNLIRIRCFKMMFKLDTVRIPIWVLLIKSLYLLIVGTCLVLLGACFEPKADETTPVPILSSSVEQSNQVRIGLATIDLGVGNNRFAFGILDKESKPVRLPSVRATFMFIEKEPYEVKSQRNAQFIRWPTGKSGVYLLEDVTFDKEGNWGLLVDYSDDSGDIYVGQISFEVKKRSSAPAIGEIAPNSINKTVNNGFKLSEITSSPEPDLDLYSLTIQEAVNTEKPTLIVFASPAFCQTATCGPQIKIVSNIKDIYKNAANFIHIEVFDNPSEMQGNFSKAKISPLMEEWSLVSEPFTFIVDKDGIITRKFEGFTTSDELVSALKKLIE